MPVISYKVTKFGGRIVENWYSAEGIVVMKGL